MTHQDNTETRVTPGALVLTSDIDDNVYSSIDPDTQRGTAGTFVTNDIGDKVCFVVATLRQKETINYYRTYIVAHDVIGWILVSESEVICDSPA